MSGLGSCVKHCSGCRFATLGDYSLGTKRWVHDRELEGSAENQECD